MDINNNQQTNTFTKGMNTDTADMYIPSDLYRYAENLRYVTDVDNNTGELSTILSGKHLVLLKINTNSDPAEDDPQGGEQGSEEPQPQELTWEINGDGRVIKLGESEVSLLWGEGYVVQEYEIISATWYDSLFPPDHVDTPENIKSIPIQICPDVGSSYWFVDGVRYDERVPNATIVYVTMQNDGLGLKFSLNSPLMGIFNKVNTIWPITIKYHVKGVKINPSGGRSDVPAISTELKFDKIYATTTIRNYGVIVCKLQGESGWSIVRYNKDTNSLYRVFGPCEEELGEDVSIVTRWESDNNIKAYIADGVHELISLNIDDAHIGEVYTSMKDLTGYADVPLPQITVAEGSGGQLLSAIVQYAYVLYKYGGRLTLTSPLSKPYSLYKNDHQGYYDELSDKSLILNILGLSSEQLDRIKIYRITYVKSGQQPTINVIYDDTFDSNFSYVDAGRNVIEVTVADFLQDTDLKIKPLLIDSKNDYLFAGNILYSQEDVDTKFENYSSDDFSVSITSKQYTTDYFGKIVNNANNYAPSLRVGETYRYGIVLYDELGRKSTVKWLTDISVPEDRQYVDLTLDNYSSVTRYYNFNTFGVSVRVPAGIPNCSGFEIVRCKREIQDSKTLFDGFVGLVQLRYDENQNLTYLVPFPYLTNLKLTFASVDYLVFACPEYAYLKDDVLLIIELYKNNININYKRLYGVYYHATLHFGKIPGTHMYDDTVLNTGVGIVVENNSIKCNVTHDESFANVRPDNKYIVDDIDIYPALVTPYTNIKNYSSSEKIDDICYADSPEYNGFSDGDNFKIQDNAFYFSNILFINWSGINIDNFKNGGYLNFAKDKNLAKRLVYSSGGRCMLFKTDVSDIIENYGVDSRTDVVPILTATVSKQVLYPYGGNDNTSKKYSTYYSYGDYFKYDGTEKTVNVYDGDVFNGMFIYNAAHAFYTDRFYFSQCPVVYSVPVQSSIDLKATCGDLYPYIQSSLKYLFQDEPVTYMGYTLSKPAYLYNTVYNTTPNIMSYSYVEKTDIDTGKYDTRIHYAGPKTNGESIDSWVKFKAADFLDVDTRYGELTHIRLFKDALMYWQRNATGVLSVNERTVLQDVNDTNIILGTGDVLQRYDYLTTEYGMKPAHHSETQSNTTLYWWDGYKREIVGYSGGQNVQPLNKVKTVSNYINENGDIDKPAFEYDYKYNEVLMNVVDRGTLVYNEFTQAFTSIYTIDFDHSMRFSDELILEANNMFDVWNQGDYNLKPLLWYVVNNNPQMVKTYDNCVFGLGEKWHTYTGGSTVTVDNEWRHKPDDKLNALKFLFFTKGLNSSIDGTKKDSFITSREYDYRFAIPRYDDAEYGNRMRGKVMRVLMSLLDDNSYYKDFSIQYITTKYRISLS